MTATLKVLLRRYVWERRFRPSETAIVVVSTTPAEAPTAAAKPASSPATLPVETALTP
jgi:hypothetical protein